VRLRAGAFTNFTRDHLDYHETFEAYFEAKLRLFTALLGAGAGAVVNLGGEMGGQIADAAHKAGLGVMTVGRGGAELGLIAVRPEDDHLAVEVALETGRRELAIPLFGTFQAENALVAAGLAAAGGGVSLDDAVTALEHLEGARGRLELVGATRAGAKVFVDYAHTPGALAVVLAALRAHTRRRLIVVFGAGGDRDAGKRVLMGRAAAAGADEVIVTDDNPRHEDAGAIRKAVLEGVPAAREIGGRRDAIAEGVCRLGDGDVLLVAGKGHESGQIVGDEVLPFSDHHEIRRALGGSEAA
jgi:UDP-N-acetylmuramoyl-L-alanyl-D-glutamate--2,6-diaminopimelate ligase